MSRTHCGTSLPDRFLRACRAVLSPLVAVAAFLVIVGALTIAFAPQALTQTQAVNLATVVSGLDGRPNSLGANGPVLALTAPTDGSVAHHPEIDTGGPAPQVGGGTEAARITVAPLGTSWAALDEGIPFAAIGAVLIAGAVSVMAVVARWHEEGYN